ncbi:MAG TPA: hypothetical protein VH143_11820 [Kofleriaceae bacterium]|jgi:hypothetical protein|nr:hypothetical protein [Kofleriaceae bacterium]
MKPAEYAAKSSVEAGDGSQCGVDVELHAVERVRRARRNPTHPGSQTHELIGFVVLQGVASTVHVPPTSSVEAVRGQRTCQGCREADLSTIDQAAGVAMATTG